MSTKAWCFGLGVESVCAFQRVMCFLARSSARGQSPLGNACLASFTRSYHSFKHGELLIKPSAVVLQSPRSRGMTCLNSATEKRNNMRDCMALASMHGEAPEPTRVFFATSVMCSKPCAFSDKNQAVSWALIFHCQFVHHCFCGLCDPQSLHRMVQNEGEIFAPLHIE